MLKPLGSRHASHAALAALVLAAADADALAQLRAPVAYPEAVQQLRDPVLLLSSSSSFLNCTPQQQASLLHSLGRPLNATASDDHAVPLLDRLLAVCESPLYAKLDARSRLAAIRVANLDIPTFERLFKPQLQEPKTGHSTAQPRYLAPEDLVDSAGESLLLRLDRLADIPITPLGCSGRLATRQLVQVLADPSTLRQHAATCFSTVLVHQLATTHPAEFVRLNDDLITTGKSKTSCGLELSLHPAWLERSMHEPYGFPARFALPWALFQALHARPLPQLAHEPGLAELPPGPDVARFLGCHTDLRQKSSPSQWRAAAGDIIFVVGDQYNQGHVLKVTSINESHVSLYDPAGPSHLRVLVGLRLGSEARQTVDTSGPYARIPIEILNGLTQASYRFTPLSGDAPSFGLMRDERRVRVFPDRAAVQRFIDKNSAASVETASDRRLLPSLLVLAGLASVAAYRLITRRRPPL